MTDQLLGMTQTASAEVIHKEDVELAKAQGIDLIALASQGLPYDLVKIRNGGKS